LALHDTRPLGAADIDSGFGGYPRDRYTTLQETSDRIFCTVNSRHVAIWPAAFGLQPRVARGAGGVARLICRARKPLRAAHALPEIREIRPSLRNNHYHLLDLSPFSLDNPNVVFLPTDEPHGLIEAILKRD